MRTAIMMLLGLGGVLSAVASSAEEYSIVEGDFTDAATGESVALTGRLVIEPVGVFLASDTVLHAINDFELQAGDETYLARLPVEYDGKVPIGWLQLADQIYFNSDRATGFRVRAGGELVDVSGDEVTFRYFDFEVGNRSGPSLIGSQLGGELPRRFHLRGAVYQVDQTFRISGGSCSTILRPNRPMVVPPSLPIDGGVIFTIFDGGGIRRDSGSLSLHEYSSFDFSQGETALFTDDAGLGGGGNVITRVTGDTQLIDAPVDFVVTDNLTIFAATTLPLPTLEELFISASDGAVISFAEGLLTVESNGDLTLFGPIPGIDGLTGLRIVTAGSIFVLRDFELSPLLTIEFNAGVSVEIGGDIVIAPDTVPPCDVVTLDGLIPLLPVEETELGTFAITASSATQVEIDLLPRHDRNRLRLGTRQWVSLAILGSDDFDVRDIDPDSLRLGPAEGEPLAHHGRPIAWIFDVDRTRPRHRDLFTIFDLRTLGVSYTDTELCVSAQTYGGETIEGCDEIDAMPRIRPRAHPRRDQRRHRGRDRHRR